MRKEASKMRSRPMNGRDRVIAIFNHARVFHINHRAELEFAHTRLERVGPEYSSVMTPERAWAEVVAMFLNHSDWITLISLLDEFGEPGAVTWLKRAFHDLMLADGTPLLD